MPRMTKEEAQQFVLSIVPDGVGDKAWADQWCNFLNYVTDSDAFVSCQIEDKDHWANTQWFVST